MGSLLFGGQAMRAPNANATGGSSTEDGALGPGPCPFESLQSGFGLFWEPRFRISVLVGVGGEEGGGPAEVRASLQRERDERLHLSRE